MMTTFRHATTLGALALAAAAGQADAQTVTFADAIAIAEGASPNGTVIEVEYDTTNTAPRYEVYVYFAAIDEFNEIKIDPETGEIFRNQLDFPDDRRRAEVAQVIDLLPGATITLIDGMQAATDAAMNTDVTEIEWRIRAGTLVVEVEFGVSSFTNEFYVDAISGVATQDDRGHHGGGHDDDTLGFSDPQGLLDALAAAEALYPGFHAYEAEYDIEHLQESVEVKLVPADFTPGGRKINLRPADLSVIEDRADFIDADDLADLQAVFAQIPDFDWGLDDSVAAALAQFPGALVNEIEWELEHGLAVVATTLVIDGVPQEFYVRNGDIVPDDHGGHHGGDGRDDVVDPSMTVGFGPAIAAAQTAFPDLVPIKAELEGEHGLLVFDVDLLDPTDLSMMQVRLDATNTGVISTADLFVSEASLPRLQQILDALPLASVTFDDAIASAQADFPDAFVHEVKLKIEQGALVYEVELRDGLSEYRVLVDAMGAPPIAMALAAPLCLADWNIDGFVNDTDFFVFVNDFFAGQNADITNDRFVNNEDWFFFTNEFFSNPCGR